MCYDLPRRQQMRTERLRKSLEAFRRERILPIRRFWRTQEKEWHPDAGFAPNVTALPARA